MATHVIDTGSIILARLEPADLAEAQQVFEQNVRYHRFLGRGVDPAAARKCFDKEPPKPVKGVKVFKRFLGVFPSPDEDVRNIEMIGVADIYVGYPGYQIATISTFMLRESWQHKGLGTQTIDAIVKWLARNHPAVEWLDASITDNNIPATKFLLKSGFDRTDSWHEVGEGDEKRRVIRLERKLK